MPDRGRTLLDRRTTGVSLAVALTDGYTGGRPLGNPRVRIAERDAVPIRTPGGYHVFLDEPAGSVTLEIDGGNLYLDEVRGDITVVDLSDPDTVVDPRDRSTLPIVDVDLIPAPAYRFPKGVTRLRGRVEASDGTLLEGATLSVSGLAPETRSADEGEFVLYFPDLTAEDVYDGGDGVGADSGRFVTDGDGDPDVEVTHDGETVTRSVRVEVGTLTVYNVTVP